MRNYCNQELIAAFGGSWSTEPAFRGIDQRLHNSICKTEELVKRTVKRENKKNKTSIRQLTNGDTVAALSFGFWTSLLEAHLEHSIWTRAIVKAFPNYSSIEGTPITRGAVYDVFNRIRLFRNRIAHHEPIFYRKLNDDHALLVKASSWLSSDVTNWINVESAECLALLAAGQPS